MLNRLLFVVILGWVAGLVWAVTPPDTAATDTGLPEKIQLNTFLENSRVPLNRPVLFHVELSWEGELSRYQIEPVSQPILTNLLMEGSGSENRLEPLPNGKFRAVKSITFRFKPLEMGMAYIDGVRVKYRDNIKGTEDFLTSQRVMVEIVDPLPEAGDFTQPSLFYIILFAIFLGVIAYAFIVFLKKRKLAQKEPEIFVPLAEQYLEKMTAQIDPKSGNLKEMLDRLTRLFREYLQRQFGLRAADLSEAVIGDRLQEAGLEADSVQQLSDLFKKLEEIRFSGKTVDPVEFTRIYGIIEAFLLKRKAVEIAEHGQE